MIDDDEAYGLRCDIGRLEVENAKLREELAKWEQLAAGINLPEYPVTQFKPKDLERENAELKAELNRVLGEQEGHRHSIGEATVTITPTLGWSGVARELRAIAATLAGDAE